MNFSVTDSRGEDRSHFTRPIQGPYKTNPQEPVKLPEPETKEEPPHHKFQMNEIKTEFKPVQIQEQFFEQKIEIPKSLPLERRPKPLQLQRTRFQPRRRETSRLSQETQEPQSLSPTALGETVTVAPQQAGATQQGPTQGPHPTPETSQRKTKKTKQKNKTKQPKPNKNNNQKQNKTTNKTKQKQNKNKGKTNQHKQTNKQTSPKQHETTEHKRHKTETQRGPQPSYVKPFDSVAGSGTDHLSPKAQDRQHMVKQRPSIVKTLGSTAGWRRTSPRHQGPRQILVLQGCQSRRLQPSQGHSGTDCRDDPLL